MNDKQPVSFPGWKGALALSNLSPLIQSSHTREIITFLHHCKKSHSPATVILIKQYLLGREPRIAAHAVDSPIAARPQGKGSGPAHDALRWFYSSAPKEAGDDRNVVEGNPWPSEAVAAASSSPRRNDEVRSQVADGESVSGLLRQGFKGQGANRSSSASKTYNQRPPWQPMEPRPAALDLGGPDYDQAMVATLRVRGLSW